jgi:hypothetical protein
MRLKGWIDIWRVSSEPGRHNHTAAPRTMPRPARRGQRHTRRLRPSRCGDVAALADEYVHTNLVGQRETKDQEIAEFSPGGAFSLLAGQVDRGVARRYGEVAVLRADVRWVGATYKPPGQPAIDVSGEYSVTRLYVRRAGRWQLAASHASRQRPA